MKSLQALIWTGIAAMLWLGGCANVVVHKIPTPTQYDAWDAAKQAEADKIKGFRYYLPRPFVAVKKEFPLNSETKLTTGTLAPDGRLVSLDLTKLEGWPTKQKEILKADTEIWVESGSGLAGNPRAQAGELGTSKTTPPAPHPWELAAPIAVTATIKHLAQAGTPYSASLAIAKATLGTDDCKLSTIRGFALVSFEAGKITGTHELPMALYTVNAAGDGGTWEMKNGVLPQLPAGSYVFAVRFVRTIATVTHELIAHPPLTMPQLTVKTGWSGTDPVLGGSADLSTPDEPVKVKGIMPATRAHNVAGPDERLDIAFTVELAKLTSPLDNKKFEPGTAKDAGVITAMGLVPDVGGVPKKEKAVRLPFTGGTAKDKPGAVDFIGVVNYEKQSRLEVGSYYLAAWITTGTDTDVKTTLVISEGTALTVSKPPPPKDPTPTPTPGTNPPRNTPAANTPVPNTPIGGSSPSVPAPTPAGELDASLGGNPLTSPLIKVNDVFDIMMLPDFDEQYAVEAKPRLSVAKLNLELEQGWQLERVGLVVDNKAIAQFIFDQVGKTLDLGRDLVKLSNGLLLPLTTPSPSGTTATTGGPTPQSGDGPASLRPAIFKVHRRTMAVPGLYPVLKPREIQQAAKAAAQAAAHDYRTKHPTASESKYQEVAMRELLRQGLVRFSLREEIVIELVTFAQPAKPAVPARNEDVVEDLTAKIQAFADARGKFKVLKILAQDNATNIKVVLSLKGGGAATEALRKSFEERLNAEGKDISTKQFTVELSIQSPT